MASQKKLSVTAKREDFRRAGYVFGKTPVVFDASELSAATLKILKNEPMLTVAEVDAKVETPSDPAVRNAKICEAIGMLDPSNEELWTRGGKPDLAALSAITGWAVTAVERDNAWAEVKPAA